MSIQSILAEIDSEIARLQQAKQLLTGTQSTAARKIPSKPRTQTRRVLSAEARARIAAAQRQRWAKARKTASKTAPAKSK